MSNNSKSDANLYADSKYQRFSSSIDHALKSIELAKDTQELGACLAKLHKVLLAYTHFKILPHKYAMTKHLSNCLRPNFPGIVHSKVLEIYSVMFDRIGKEGLSRDLFIYTSGLYPLFDHASTQVRSQVLDMFDQYLLALGPGLLPGLQGFVMALLPGLEEGSECIQRVYSLLDSASFISLSAFIITLWNILYRSPSLRQSTVVYMMSHLNKGKSAISQSLKRFGEHQDIVVLSLCSSLCDSNVTVVKQVLNVVSILVPLNNTSLPSPQLTMIVTAVLQTLTKRDNSLSRRVYNWLLGNLQPSSPVDSNQNGCNGEDSSTMYLTSFVYPRITAAIKSTLNPVDINFSVKNFSRSEHLVAHRILKALVERVELHELLLKLLPDYLIYLKYQMKQVNHRQSSASEVVQRLLDKNRTSLMEDLFLNANQFLCGLNSSLLWDWAKDFLLTDIENAKDKVTELVDRKQLVLILIQFLPQLNSEPIVSTYLPNLIVQWINSIHSSLDSLPQSKLVSFISFISSLLYLLNQFIHSLGLSKTSTPFTIDDNISFPDHFHKCRSVVSHDNPAHATPTHFIPPSNDGEGTTPTVYSSILHHLEILFNSTLNLFNRFVNVYIVSNNDGEEISKDLVTEVLRGMGGDTKGRFQCGVSHDEGYIEDVPLALCMTIMQSADMVRSLMTTVSKEDHEESIDPVLLSSLGLLTSSLSTRNIHVFIASLNTLVKLWTLEKDCHDTCLSAMMEQLSSDSKLKKDFIKVAAELLWDTLTQPVLSAHHSDASSLLYRLHSLSLPSSVVEDVILEKFAQANVVPYQVFMVFWKYSLYQRDTVIFKRLLLRVLEGLQCTDPFISQCTVTWVKTLSDTNQLSVVLLPLYNLITEATPPKQIPQYESPRTPKPFGSHAQYYFNSIPLPEEESVKEVVPLYPLYYFTQSVDAPRLHYGLSLFLSLLSVDPISICTHLASTYMAHSSGYSSPVDTPNSETDVTSGLNTSQSDSTPQGKGNSRPTTLRSSSSVAKSLLELLLTHCSHILLTDYSSKLNIHQSDMRALTNIKITSVNVLVNILDCIATMIHGSGANRPSLADGSNLNNSTYVLCLLALCDIQKTTLVGILQLVDVFKNESHSVVDSDKGQDPKGASPLSRSLYMSIPHLQPLFLQLLKVLYYGICLESMATNVAESPVARKKFKKLDHNNSSADEGVTTPEYIPGVSLVLQPLFFHIFNAILSRGHLMLQQTYLLSVVCHAMVHFRESLEIIAPKLLKQVYRNLKEMLAEKNHKRSTEDVSGNSTRSSSVSDVNGWEGSGVCQSDEIIGVYLSTISHIVHYCLLQRHGGPTPLEQLNTVTNSKKTAVLHFRLIDPFRSLPSLQLSSKHVTDSAPIVHSAPPTSDKSSFSLGWFLGGMFASSTGGDIENDKQEEGVAKPSEYCGVYAPVGQKILWQLQHVYGVVVRVWRESIATDGLLSAPLRKDLNSLVKQFLQPMIVQNCTLFYTTVAHTWMHWNLVGKSKQLMKDSFIRLLHLYKLQSLVEMLDAVGKSLDSMVESKDDSNKDRQKYLLHFLHYYLSSPLQSEDELASSFSTIMGFLKESFYTFVDHNPSCNTSLLCMLTSILHVYVRRSPVIPDPQTNKKQRKDLQDLIHKYCESLSAIVDSNISQAIQTYQHQTTLQQNSSKNSGKQSPEDKPHPKGVAKSVGQSDCEVQAIVLLSNVLPCFIDKVYSDERDRNVSYFLKIVLKPVWTILRSFSLPTKHVYPQAVRLLLAVSECLITRKFWKDEVLDLLMDPFFFAMDKNSIYYWKAIVNNLVSQDKSVFAGILGRLAPPTPVPGGGTMVGSLDQDRKYRSRMLKRIAFILLSGDHNQYISQLNDIIDKLGESVSHFSCPMVSGHVLLILRAMLVKVSSDGLAAIWPILLSELTLALTELQSDLGIELATPQVVTRDRLYWYWSVCRTLETIATLPDAVIPHWQMVSWGFFGVMFGESLEKDIAETSIDAANEEAELPRPDTNDSESSVVNGVPNVNESMTTPTDRWSLMDDILQVYKEHTQDMKQVKLSAISRLPMAYEVKSVKQLVGFLNYLNTLETSPSAGNRGNKAQVMMEELVRQITFDFID